MNRTATKSDANRGTTLIRTILTSRLLFVFVSLLDLGFTLVLWSHDALFECNPVAALVLNAGVLAVVVYKTSVLALLFQVLAIIRSFRPQVELRIWCFANCVTGLTAAYGGVLATNIGLVRLL